MANYRDYGFCGVIPKPYRLEDLGRILKEVIGNGPTSPPAGAPPRRCNLRPAGQPRHCDIARNLTAQTGQGGEFSLVAKLAAQFNFQFFAVKIAVKIQQMRLDTKLRRPGRNRRMETDVQRDAVGLLSRLARPA